jgi:hypothetical protein
MERWRVRFLLSATLEADAQDDPQAWRARARRGDGRRRRDRHRRRPGAQQRPRAAGGAASALARTGLAPAHGRAAGAGGAARARQRPRGRRREGARRAAARAARPPRRRERVGVVVRAVPLRAAVLPAPGGRERGARRVPRRELGRQPRRRAPPERTHPDALSLLRGSAPGDRRALPPRGPAGDRVLRRPRQARARPSGALRVRGRARAGDAVRAAALVPGSARHSAASSCPRSASTR